jgi:hypothetical protein
MSCRPRRALMLGLVAAATAVAIVPAAAATKARPRPPAPLTIYPSTTSCPQSGNATYALDTVPGDAADNCMALEVGTDGAGKPVGPRSDEDYLATSRVKVKLAKSGSIAGTIGINATTFEGGAAFVGYADVSLTMVINNVVVGTVEKSGPITPTADLAVPVRWSIPASLRGKKIGSMDLFLHWNVPGGATFVDPDASSLRIPRS